MMDQIEDPVDRMLAELRTDYSSAVRQANGEDGAPPRPSWDQYFMKITRVVAERSTCLRRQVGAVIVKGKRILATGYNGAPKDVRHCDEAGCIRQQKNIASGERHELCRGIHAEQNAIIQAAMHGVPIRGSSIYCTHYPCVQCAKMIVNAGIKRVYYLEGYPDDLAKDIFGEAAVLPETVLLENVG